MAFLILLSSLSLTSLQSVTSHPSSCLERAGGLEQQICADSPLSPFWMEKTVTVADTSPSFSTSPSPGPSPNHSLSFTTAPAATPPLPKPWGHICIALDGPDLHLSSHPPPSPKQREKFHSRREWTPAPTLRAKIWCILEPGSPKPSMRYVYGCYASRLPNPKQNLILGWGVLGG